MKKENQTVGYLCAILGGVCWALSGVCGQYIFMNKGFDSGWLVPVRLLLAGILLTGYSLVRDWRRAVAIWKSPRDILDLVLFAATGLSMCQYSYFTAIQLSNAAVATVICYLDPVLVMLYVSLRHRQRPSRTEGLCVALVVLGTFLCATHGHLGSMAISPKALIWGLISAGCFAAYSIQPRRMMERHDTTVPLGWGLLLGGLGMCAVMRPWEKSGVVDWQTLTALGVVVLFGTIAAFNLYSQGVRRVGPTKGSILAAVEPVTSTVLSALWLHVTFQPIDLLGFGCIISTIFLLTLKKGQGGAEHPA